MVVKFEIMIQYGMLDVVGFYQMLQGSWILFQASFNIMNLDGGNANRLSYLCIDSGQVVVPTLDRWHPGNHWRRHGGGFSSQMFNEEQRF